MFVSLRVHTPRAPHFQSLEIGVASFSRGWKIISAIVVALLVSAHSGSAQMVFTSTSLVTNQNFDAVGGTGTSLSGIGWFVSDGTTQNQTLTGVVTNRQNTSSLAHGRYNCGSTGNAPDRAVGMVASGSGEHRLGVPMTNSTGSTITNIAISAKSEKYRHGSSTATNEVMLFEYKINGTNLNDATGWTAVSALNLGEASSNSVTTSAAVDGNDPTNQVISTGSFALSLTNGQIVWIRWRDVDNTGTDALLALDDFFATAQVFNASAPAVDVLGTNLAVIVISNTAPAYANGTDFGGVGVNQSNVVRTFNITNSGTASLGISTFSMPTDQVSPLFTDL